MFPPRTLSRLSALFLFIPLSPLSAQSPDDIVLLGRWEAQVNQAASVRELERLLDTAMVGPGERALGVLRRALGKRRLGELAENRRYFDEALEEFWAVVLARRRWPYGWYGLGSTKCGEAVREGTADRAPHSPPGRVAGGSRYAGGSTSTSSPRAPTSSW